MTDRDIEPNRLTNLDELKQEAASKPKDLHAQYRYGWALLGLGMVDEARQVFEASQAKWPDEIEILYGQAMVLKQMGDADKARALFDKIKDSTAENVSDAMLKRMAEVQTQIILGSKG